MGLCLIVFDVNSEYEKGPFEYSKHGFKDTI